MPPRQGKESEGDSYNPILSLPEKSDAFNAEALDDMPMTHSCSRCGSIAVGHMPGVGENSVDLVSLRKTMPWSNGEVASEVVPGLIWAGNASAAKLNPILDQGITLVINCTNNMGNLEVSV